MRMTVLAAALLAAPSMGLAQTAADSAANSQAQSNVHFGNTNYERPAPGLGGIGGNSTAPCIVAQGFGLVGPGAGIQYSGGRVDDACLTRTEAAMLKDLLDMRPTAGRQAAIYHACKYSERLRDSLVAAGVCVLR